MEESKPSAKKKITQSQLPTGSRHTTLPSLLLSETPVPTAQEETARVGCTPCTLRWGWEWEWDQNQ